MAENLSSKLSGLFETPGSEQDQKPDAEKPKRRRKKWLPVAEAAAMFVKHERTLRVWKRRGAKKFFKVKNGLLVVDVMGLREWAIETGKIKAGAKIQINAERKKQHPNEEEPEEDTLTAVRIRKERALAAKHEWDLALRKSEFIHRDKLLDLMAKIGQTLKGKLIAQPSRLCARFADIDDARELQREWDAEQWQLLDSISKEFGVPND